MPNKSYLWIRIAHNISELSFNAKQIAAIEVEGKNICIGKFMTGLFAFTSKCPHAGGSLADGHIDSFGNIICPTHQYRYNLVTGRDSLNEGYFMKTWPVQVKEDGVFIGFERDEVLGTL